jgi:hypothetical protein
MQVLGWARYHAGRLVCSADVCWPNSLAEPKQAIYCCMQSGTWTDA